MEEMQVILMGDVVCEGYPLKGKKNGEMRGERNERKKLQKLIFSKLESMRKMDISRQTKCSS